MSKPEVKVYISGPITGLAEEEFKKNFADAAELLKSNGFTPVNPCELEVECGETCGSELTFTDGSYQHHWSCYMKTDLKALLDCEGIFMLDGWRNSKGAKLEYEVAVGIGLPRLYRDEDGDLVW